MVGATGIAACNKNATSTIGYNGSQAQFKKSPVEASGRYIKSKNKTVKEIENKVKVSFGIISDESGFALTGTVTNISNTIIVVPETDRLTIEFNSYNAKGEGVISAAATLINLSEMQTNFQLAPGQTAPFGPMPLGDSTALDIASYTVERSIYYNYIN